MLLQRNSHLRFASELPLMYHKSGTLRAGGTPLTAPQYRPFGTPSRKDRRMTELTPDNFRKACGHWATGVSVITACDTDGKGYGLTMNGITSLSLDPALFIICVDNKSETLEPIRRSGAFAINVLASGQQDLSNRFAKKGPDKFDGVPHTKGSSGSPLLDGRLMAIECTVQEIHAGGDHQIIVGHVQALSLPESEDLQPLLYYRGKYAALGA